MKKHHRKTAPRVTIHRISGATGASLLAAMLAGKIKFSKGVHFIYAAPKGGKERAKA